MSDDGESLEAKLTEVFLELFRAHDLPCVVRDGWIAAVSGDFIAQPRIFQRQWETHSSAVLDFEVYTRDDDRILETCAGFGPTMNDAIKDAIDNFCNSSFHVLYSALTTHEPCSHCDVETWQIAGTARRVYVGPMVCRGSEAIALVASMPWFATMAEAIQQSPLTSGLHWIRLYHCESPGIESVSEVLLDNETWSELQVILASLEWPASEGFYSARVFLMIRDEA